MKVMNHEYFSITYSVSDLGVWIDLFEIHDKYRGKRLSYSIWQSLSDYFNKDIHLMCFFTLISYYEKVGFTNTGEYDNQDYHVMEYKYDPSRNEQLLKLT